MSSNNYRFKVGDRVICNASAVGGWCECKVIQHNYFDYRTATIMPYQALILSTNQYICVPEDNGYCIREYVTDPIALVKQTIKYEQENNDDLIYLIETYNIDIK